MYMHYKVYLVKLGGVHLGQDALFVETKNDGSGIIYSATGDVREYVTTTEIPSELSAQQFHFRTKEFLGPIGTENYETHFESICTQVQIMMKQSENASTDPLGYSQQWTENVIGFLVGGGLVL